MKNLWFFSQKYKTETNELCNPIILLYQLLQEKPNMPYMDTP